MSTPTGIRARRPSLLWLLRSLYVARLALAYFVMIRGRHARPDLVLGCFAGALFADLLIFLTAFFSYLPHGRFVVRLDAVLRPLVLGAIVAAALAWVANPAAALGWTRGPVAPGLLLLEFVLLPLLALALTRAIDR